MNVLGRVLDQRETRDRDADEADDRWLTERAGINPDERRAAWRRWLRKELERTLQWPKNEAARDRLIGQCMAEITILARQLRGRGWLLEGTALAVHVWALLAPIAKAQKAGKIKDFWPYFGEAVTRYVGANAEEIQAHARRTRADESTQSMAGALAVFGLLKTHAGRAPSLTELVAARDAQIQKEKAAKMAADAAQLKLL